MWVALRLLLIAFAMMCARPGLAEPSTATQNAIDRARAMGEQGVVLFDKGQYTEALVLFERAEALHHAPTLVLYIARSYDKLGRLLEAVAHYRAVLAEELNPDAPDQFERARAAAHDEVDLLIPRIPSVKIETTGPAPETITVRVNGKPLPRVKWPRHELDPGEHTFEASATGYVPLIKNIVVPEGGRIDVALALEPVPTAPTPPPPPPDPLPLSPAWIALGAGGAALIVAAVTGGMHLAQVDDLRSRCRPDNHCPAADAEDASDAQTLATISTITVVVGGALVAAGATYAIVTVASADDTAALEVTPTSARLRLRF